eukprot:Gregarina_sp_Poly_1__4460@NODE_23_length_20322_cov_242_373192_g21_i0_p3_GENE_NODE_23_length_20322_cov_242_373192_g21_i0NODE_23_length_20322_cov_242_373192_g21_i0_p3_ORF_typecomplete_len839_score93_14PLDc_2/PF13091_6/9_8PLDc_2/PF13091_6/5_5e18PLDc/PF00614_22/5_6e03PLDc/PF00614_22/1e07PLDc/PF00614_22/2_8e06PLD_C/PF12357_8/4_8e16C2/PF00168_30/4_8e09APH/PF01636_23/1_1e02APH/PF01636_23/1_2Arc/PF03869_14/1_1e02Arc/PF03869_14/13Arc/PF03869_14/4_9e03_NODE_23_length_20322_cov_242_373192_g21_i028485364
MVRFFGLLHVHVVSGSNLTHSYKAFRRRRTHASCYRKVLCGADFYKCGGADPCRGDPDPYAVVSLEVDNGKHYRMGRTRTMKGHDPVWGDEFTSLVDVNDGRSDDVFGTRFFSSSSGPCLLVSVFDDDMAGPYEDDLLCSVSIPLRSVATKNGQPVKAEVVARHPRAKEDTPSHSKIKLEFKWFSFAAPVDDPMSSAVPHAYFRRSHGNIITLYHDAHCIEGDFPRIPIPGSGAEYTAASCWDDIEESMTRAQSFILVAGWSVNTATRLTRSYTGADHPSTVGEILLKKADQGLKVVVMVWDDITSQGIFKDGLMATYDEYTKAFFKGSSVEVILAKRVAADDVGTMLYPLVGALKGTSFTHHQKIVLCDAANPIGGAKRILCAYVGGLDLTTGRYDTSRHEMFDTLQTAHHEDFYNGCLVEASSPTGPREPWHDIHARVLGPGAWDVYTTYMERLEKQAAETGRKLQAHVAQLLESQWLRDSRSVLIHPDDSRSWDVQVFRSLDTESAIFSNSKWLKKYTSKRVMVDRSIAGAYLYLIDRAQRFIFIENQYFLGSAQYWDDRSDTPAWHLIPYELVRRICRAIHERKRFCVYVLTPLYPEGVPSSMTVQEILYWQYQTVNMMYRTIGAKLTQMGETSSCPTDYLQFFFVGKREPEAQAEVPPKASVELENAITAKRFPIYVHSKMMISDDEYIILGSANINDRSMSGCRDTEIAVGCCQPHYQVVEAADGRYILPQGDISAFRLQLWHEHLGQILPEYADPGDLECAKKVRRLATENWDVFSGSENLSLPHGHLCTYPYHVSKDGTVGPLTTNPNIPGTEAPVCGCPSTMLPGALTT